MELVLKRRTTLEYLKDFLELIEVEVEVQEDQVWDLLS